MGVEEQTIKLTKWLYSVPSSTVTSFIIIVWSIFIGILISLLGPSDFMATVAQTIVSSIFTIALPAFLTAITIYIIKKHIGFRRTLFISFAGAIIFGLNYLVYYLTQSITFMILSFGFVFILWFATLYIIFGLRKSAMPFSIAQVMFSLMFFTIDQQTITQNLWGILIKIYVSALIMLIALYYLIRVINAPMKRNLGISSTDAAYFFFEQWMFGSKKIEEMMEQISHPVITTVDWVTLNGLMFVVPYLHFGPFGNVGGSRFTEIIPAKLGRSVVFHAPVTRDFNPANETAADTIVEEINKTRTPGKKLKGAFFKVMANSAYSNVVVLNDFVIVSLSRAPYSTEDIDIGLGEAIKRIIESSGYNALIIDMHNSETNDINSILPGSKAAEDYLAVAEKIRQKLKIIKKEEVKIGYNEVPQHKLDKMLIKKIGGAGIKTVSFIFKKKPYTMVVIDCNGIRPDARYKVTELDCEVYTTDTHAVNTVRGVINPLKITDVINLRPVIEQSIAKSIENAKEVNGAFNRAKITVNVLGRNKTTEIITTLNSIIAIAKFTVPVIIVLSILIILWVLQHLNNIGI